MPLYEFQCKCGLRFEERLMASKASSVYKCPDCGKDAERFVGDVSSTFQFQSDGVNTVTGVTSIDTDYDRIIGEDSKKGWEIHSERESDKRKLMNDNGVDKKSIAIGNDGYVVLKDKERDDFRRIRGFNNSVINNIYRKDPK